MNIGMIVAIETDALKAHYGKLQKLSCPQGFELFHVKKNENDLYILHTGMGVIKAAAGVQYLISKRNVSVIVNFGVVGGLSSEMKCRKVVVVKNVVHYKYDCSEFMDLVPGQVDGHDSIYLSADEKLLAKALKINPELLPVTICSGDKFVGTEKEKKYLHDTFKGDICDMESSGIVLTCEINNVPCLMLKAVSDALADGAKTFYEELQDASAECLKVTDKIIDEL